MTTVTTTPTPEQMALECNRCRPDGIYGVGRTEWVDDDGCTNASLHNFHVATANRERPYSVELRPRRDGPGTRVVVLRFFDGTRVELKGLNAGYRGTGPHGLLDVLHALGLHRITIDDLDFESGLDTHGKTWAIPGAPLPKLKAGRAIGVYRNQKTRDAIVLAVIDETALIEYVMPRGMTSLNLIAADGRNRHSEKPGQWKTEPGYRSQYRAVAYDRLSVKWLEAIKRAGTDDGFRGGRDGDVDDSGRFGPSVDDLLEKHGVDPSSIKRDDE